MNKEIKLDTSDESNVGSIGLLKAPIHDPYSCLHVWPYTTGKEILKNLQRQGIVPLEGQWQSHEIDQLELNIKMLEKEIGDVNIFKLLYLQTKEYRQLRKRYDTLKKISFGIKRTLPAVLLKMKQYYKSKAGFKTGAFSEAEKTRLTHFVKVHGKDWSLLSLKMNRYANDLSIMYNHGRLNTLKNGRWSKEETKEFYSIVNQIKHEKIDWRAVSNLMGRSYMDCWNKWSRMVMKQKLNKSKPCFSLLYRNAMIIALYHSGVSNQKHINWFELVSLFDSVFSRGEIKKKWNVAKTEVPEQFMRNFQKSLYYLYQPLCHEADFINPGISFENVSHRMKYKKSPYWLRAKFFLLKQSINNSVNITTENMIEALLKQYVCC